MRSIIVYYSRTGSTAKVARAWAHRIRASRLEVCPMSWRGTPREVLRYVVCTLTRQPMEIESYRVEFDKYDRIVLMVPVFCGMMSAPMRYFILTEAGNLHNVEYVIVHKGLKLRHKSLINWLDRKLAEKHIAASSIRVTFGRKYKPARIDGESVLR